jgi:hypothetical protein
VVNEQVAQGSGVEVVQKCKKRRSQSDKVGINRYTQQLVKRCLVGIKDVKTELRWVRHMLERVGEAKYHVSEVEHFSVQDQVDREIVQRLLEVGVNGALPKDVAAEVNRRGGYGLRYYEVSRRLVRLNKRLHFETGKCLFEKRGHRWALSRFGFDVYGAASEEVEDVRGEQE